MDIASAYLFNKKPEDIDRRTRRRYFGLRWSSGYCPKLIGINPNVAIVDFPPGHPGYTNEDRRVDEIIR